MFDYDVIVVGCGPAGQKAAIKCAKVGRRVAIVDRREVVGGLCLHVGTIPSKTLREAIIYLSGYYERKVYGDDYCVKKDITVEDLLFRSNAIIRKEVQVIHDQLERNGVEVLTGIGRFTGPNSICVTSSKGPKEVSAEKFVIACGTMPHRPERVPFDEQRIIVTDEIMNLPVLPKKMLIVGGGVVGVEYAAMFCLLETEVHLISQYPDMLHFVDSELVEALSRHMTRNGVKFHFNDLIETIRVDGESVVGKLQSGTTFEADLVMFAAQRWGATLDLNLEAVGVTPDERGYLTVDEHFKTEAPNVWAAGDVIGFPSLASTSLEQGRKAANSLLGIKDTPFQEVFPYGIYTVPEISMVGASEQQLIKEGKPYLTGIGHYLDSAKGQIMFDEEGIIKILFNPDTREIYGVHIIGTQATELIHIGQAVLLNNGTLNYFIDTVFNYPTLAEVYKIAALDGRNKLGYGR